MASSVFLTLGNQGGPFVGQMIGPAASNIAAPPFTFLGDLTSGVGSSAAGTVNLVSGGVSILSASASAVTSGVPILTGSTTGTAQLNVYSADAANPTIRVGRADTAQAYGIDLGGNDFSIRDLTAATTPLKILDTSGNIVIADASTLGWSDVSLSRGAADVLLIAPGDSLNFNGVAVGDVKIKRTGAGIDVRTGNDSTYADVTARDFVASRYLDSSSSNGGYKVNGVLAIQNTAPTIASGFGTSPSIPNSNGSCAFTINVGTGGTATGGVLTMPAATTGWACHVTNLTSAASLTVDQTAGTTTSITLASYSRTTGLLTAFNASDILRVVALAY